MKTITAFYLSCAAIMLMFPREETLKLSIANMQSVDSLGPCQGVAYIGGKVYLCGDREVGMIREYSVVNNHLALPKRELLLTISDKDVINHPTGIAYNGGGTAFIGIAFD